MNKRLVCCLMSMLLLLTGCLSRREKNYESSPVSAVMAPSQTMAEETKPSPLINAGTPNLPDETYTAESNSYETEGEMAKRLVSAYLSDMTVPQEGRSFTITGTRNLIIDVAKLSPAPQATDENQWVVYVEYEYRYTGVVDLFGESSDWQIACVQGGFLMERQGNHYRMARNTGQKTLFPDAGILTSIYSPEQPDKTYDYTAADGAPIEETARKLVLLYLEDMMTPREDKPFTITETRNLTLDVVKQQFTRQILNENQWLVYVEYEYQYTGVVIPLGECMGWTAGSVFNNGTSSGFLMERQGNRYRLALNVLQNTLFPAQDDPTVIYTPNCPDGFYDYIATSESIEKIAQKLVSIYLDDMMNPRGGKPFVITQYRNLKIDVAKPAPAGQTRENQWVVNVSYSYQYDGVVAAQGKCTGWEKARIRDGFLMERRENLYRLAWNVGQETLFTD